MTPDQTNLICYTAIMVVKIMARDLGRRAMKRTFGSRAFGGRDMKHLQRLCEFIYRVDPKMGELALKVVAQNGPAAQEQEILNAARSILGKDFFKKESDYKVTVVQEDKGEEPNTQLPETPAQGDQS